MTKLSIEYRIKDSENDYFKGQTYHIISFETKAATISIAPNETRRLKELVDNITENLKNRTYIDEDEKLEIDDFNKSIMEYEESKNERVDNNVHNILQLLYPALEEGKIKTLEEALIYVNEVVSND